MNEKQQRLVAILAEVAQVDAASVKPEQHLKNDLRLDSAQALELLATIEDEFDMEIDEVAASKIATVKDVLDFADA